jgi:hypothetical protein
VRAPETAVKVTVYVPAARDDAVLKEKALFTCAGVVVTEQGFCKQVKPADAEAVTVTGAEKPATGTIPKEYEDVFVPATREDVSGETEKTKSGVAGTGIVIVAVAVWTSDPEVAVKVTA